MKQKVLELLADKGMSPDEKYDEAKALYRKSPGHNIQESNYFNRAGYSKVNLKNICYALQKLHKVGDAELKQFEIKGIEVIKEEVVSEENNNQNTGKEVNPIAKVLIAAPAEAKAGLKIRDEFSFLNDDDCPDKLKILVADRITAWNKYKEAQAAILIHSETGEPLSDEALYELASEAVDNFEKNKAIWDELNYYKENKEILGNHEIFADEQLQRKVDAMSELDGDKRVRNLKSYISKENKKLKDSKDDDKKAVIQSKIDGYQEEMDLIKAKFDAKK